MKRLLTSLAAVALYGGWMALERKAPLRKATQPKAPRVAKNVTLGALGSATLRIGFYPALLKLAGWASGKNIGLLSFLPKGRLRMVAGFFALDYTLYLWHKMNHLNAFLWRFHNPHHVDLDMDISTGSRFHFGELAFSAAPRAVEIILFGLSPATVIVYDTVAMAAVHFHHSNVRLPERFEALLNKVIVTPRMHGIHHSIVEGETDSNFSTVFSFWDRLHRSFNGSVPQSAVTIGVPAYRDPKDVTLGKVLTMPFTEQREWRLPDGRVPGREGAVRETRTA